jgi:hypothetical protein
VIVPKLLWRSEHNDRSELAGILNLVPLLNFETRDALDKSWL